MQILNKKGFTLIELLVVIAIIGILASIMVVSLTNAQKKARDAKRQSELNQLRTALTLYSDDSSTQDYPTVEGNSDDTTIQGSIFNSDCSTTNAAYNPICSEYMATSLTTVGSLPYNYAYTVATATEPAKYVAWVVLEAPPVPSYYCIDSAGKAGVLTGAIPTAASENCP